MQKVRGAACVVVLVVLLSACTARPPGLTDDEWTFCTGPRGGGGLLFGASEAWGFGLGSYSEDDPGELYADPAYVRTCRVATALWTLTDDEWNWCFDPDNRETFLAPAVALFGMGEEERAGTETFGEAPGDDPGEYAHACRYAHEFGERDGVAAIAAPDDHSFFALTEAEVALCGVAGNEDLLARAVEILEIGPEPPATDVERLSHETRTCRIAYALR